MLSASTTAFSSSTATNLPAWMIGHGIGVSTKETYYFKELDMDYFAGEV